MALSNDLARLARIIDELSEGLTADLRRGLSVEERRSARAGIERCVLRLDELRSRLSANKP
jgi:hypothetical protein